MLFMRSLLPSPAFVRSSFVLGYGASPHVSEAKRLEGYPKDQPSFEGLISVELGPCGLFVLICIFSRVIRSSAPGWPPRHEKRYYLASFCSLCCRPSNIFSLLHRGPTKLNLLSAAQRTKPATTGHRMQASDAFSTTLKKRMHKSYQDLSTCATARRG